MLGKPIEKGLPLPWLVAFLISILFLVVILAALFFVKQFDKPLVLVQNFLMSPLSKTQKQPFEVIGFLPSWTAAKQVKVDTKNLTQIIYFGLGVNQNGEIIQFDEQGNPTLEWSNFQSEYFKKIREDSKKTNTKVLIAIKGFDNKLIDDLISNPLYTEKFINQLSKILRENKLDGVNIDFEYFTDSDFPTFKHLNAFFVNLSENLKSDNSNYIISADFNASVVKHDPAYDMVKIGDTIDQIILMGYDFATVKSSTASPVSPLYSKDESSSIETSVKTMLGRVPPEKIVLAVPFYGYEWQTVDKKFQSSTIEGSGSLATYERIIQLIKNRSDLEINWDDQSQTPWLSYPQSGAIKQIYYDNEKSISKKLDFIKDKKLAGVGIWAIGYEGENTTFWELINRFRR